MVDRGCNFHKTFLSVAAAANKAPSPLIKSLSSDFQPGNNEVIWSRGSESYNHPGNVRLRHLIQERIHRYASAVTKFEKTVIVSEIVDQIMTKSDVGFVRFDKQQKIWQRVTDRLAREKVGQGFRAALQKSTGLHRSTSMSRRVSPLAQVMKLDAAQATIASQQATQQDDETEKQSLPQDVFCKPEQPQIRLQRLVTDTSSSTESSEITVVMPTNVPTRLNNYRPEHEKLSQPVQKVFPPPPPPARAARQDDLVHTLENSIDSMSFFDECFSINVEDNEPEHTFTKPPVPVLHFQVSQEGDESVSAPPPLPDSLDRFFSIGGCEAPRLETLPSMASIHMDKLEVAHTKHVLEDEK